MSRPASRLTVPGGDVQQIRSMRFPQPGGVPYQQAPEGTGPQLPIANDPPSMGQYVRSVRPPWTEKIGSVSRDFQVADYSMALAALAGATVTSTSLIFTLPASQVGWLQELSMYILSPTALADVRYTVRINGGPVPGFFRIPIFPGAANFEVIDKVDLNVRIPMGGTVDMIIENGNANAFTVGGRLAGWYHPKDSELRFWGEDI